MQKPQRSLLTVSNRCVDSTHSWQLISVVPTSYAKEEHAQLFDVVDHVVSRLTEGGSEATLRPTAFTQSPSAHKTKKPTGYVSSNSSRDPRTIIV